MSQRSRLPVYAGVAAVSAVGYYLYSAGGSPKIAEKKFEHDVSSASARLRGQQVSGKEVEKKGEELAHRAGSAVDSTARDIREKVDIADTKIGQKAHEADAKFHQLKADGTKQFTQAKNDTARELQETADTFDKTVGKKTAEAKAGISSWFGFK